MTGQHERLWKPEMKSGAPEGAFPALHSAPVMMFPMAYQGMKRAHQGRKQTMLCVEAQ